MGVWVCACVSPAREDTARQPLAVLAPVVILRNMSSSSTSTPALKSQCLSTFTMEKSAVSLESHHTEKTGACMTIFC